MLIGQKPTIILSNAWGDTRSSARGANLQNSAFDTKLVDRTNGNPLVAVLVMPVATHKGIANDGSRVAEYPVFATVAIDRDGLEILMKSGEASVENIYQTISHATQAAKTMNSASQKAYDLHHTAGRLTGVQSWSRTALDATAPISIAPAANTSAPAGHLFS